MLRIIYGFRHHLAEYAIFCLTHKFMPTRQLNYANMYTKARSFWNIFAVQNNVRKNIHSASCTELTLCLILAWRIMFRNLNLRPIKVQLTEEL